MLIILTFRCYNLVMKFAYLMYSQKKYTDIVPVVRMLVKQKDHVFIMVNDNKARDEVTIEFANNPYVHISRKLEYAQEGDLSLARGTLLQMVDAFETEEHFDYFINLTEGMLPIKPRSEIVEYLQQHPQDHYFIYQRESNNPDLRKQYDRYYVYTNVIGFTNSWYVRLRSRAISGLINLLNIKRKNQDEVFIGSPWFILTEKTARVLADNYSYCSENFKLSRYAEEMCHLMMINHFIPDNDHINDDMRVVGPQGIWEAGHGARTITEDVMAKYPDALFGGSFSEKKNSELYQSVLKIYNTGYKSVKTEEKKYTEEEFNEMIAKISGKKESGD